MPKPNLFIVGAPRCGTTAWVNYLSDHPEIFFSPAKEPHYFCEDFPGFRWVRTLEDYEALFARAGKIKVIGEASVQYLYSNIAASKIKRYQPEARILIFLRSHADFLVSYHNQLLYNRDETIGEFTEAWHLSEQRRAHNLPPTCREAKFLNYKAVGTLAPQIRRYLDLFPREQVKIVQFESWTRDPRATYVEIVEFLGLADDGRQEFALVHGAKRHKLTLGANLTQRPPDWVLASANMIKRLTGHERLGAARLIRRLNASNGYGGALAAPLRNEIEAYFADDTTTLTDLLICRDHADRPA